MKERSPRASVPRPRPRPTTPETARVHRRGLIPRAGLAAAAMSLGLAAAARLLGPSWAPSAAGLAVLIAAKMVALSAFGAARPGPGDGGRSAPVESLTLGSLVAFVASLALGPLADLPRLFVIVDWVASLIGAAAIRPARAALAPPAAPTRPATDPAIAAAIRGRAVLLACPDRAPHRALIEAIRGSGPARLAIEAIPSAEAARRVMFAHRPDVILHAPSADAGLSAGLSTRWLANEALRVGVETFALVVPDGTHALSERVVRALSGLTRTRLIRVRLADGVAPEDAARRLLRVLSRGHDGAIVTLGRSGGVAVEAPSCGDDAEALWSELNRMESARS